MQWHVKWYFLALMLVVSFSQNVMADKDGCTLPSVREGTDKYLKMGRHALIHVNYYGSSFTQGAVIFIQGPEASFKTSNEFIKSLCDKGFSVSAFDLIGKKLTRKDYIKAAKVVTKWTTMHLPKTPLITYGWSKGAQVALALAESQQYKPVFKRVLLESPVLTKGQLAKLSRSSVQDHSRIFGCASDRKFSIKKFKRTAYFVPVLVAKSDICTHHLTGSDEMTYPMAEYIEGDFHSIGLWSL